MISASSDTLSRLPTHSTFVGINADLVELTVFLPREQAADLEAAALRRGLTVGQMLRRLIGDFTGRTSSNRDQPWANA